VFYGKKNRTDLEGFLYQDSDRQMLNPEYSLFSDTAIYFLTLDADHQNFRYQDRNSGELPDPDDTAWTSSTVVYNGQFYTQASQGLIDPDFNDLEGFATGFARTVSRDIDLSGTALVGDSVKVRIGVG